MKKQATNERLWENSQKLSLAAIVLLAVVSKLLVCWIPPSISHFSKEKNDLPIKNDCHWKFLSLFANKMFSTTNETFSIVNESFSIASGYFLTAMKTTKTFFLPSFKTLRHSLYLHTHFFHSAQVPPAQSAPQETSWFWSMAPVSCSCPALSSSPLTEASTTQAPLTKAAPQVSPVWPAL